MPPIYLCRMANDIIHIQSISQLHKALGFEKPQHPLITVIDVEKWNVPPEIKKMRTSADFYSVMLKDTDCGLQYGRNYYDFEEGVLIFTGPNQVVSSTGDSETTDDSENSRDSGTPGNAKGWMLFFHPDLIRNSQLGKNIDNYSFFSYEVHEALHLSQKEKDILNDIVAKIEYEYNQNIDAHSQTLFVSHLELLLNYCLRFYERQFHTRKKQNIDVLSQVESLLKGYYESNQQTEHGTPTIQYLAENVNLSANYLSDLLKKETGKNAKEHINLFVVEKAKTLLLNSNDNVSEVAFNLGFNYPHYFSRMFKQHTGLTPKAYRDSRVN